MTSDEGGRDGLAGDAARVVSARWTMEALEPRVLLNGRGVVRDVPEWVEMVERNQYDDVYEFDAREGTTYLFEVKGLMDEVDSLSLRDGAGLNWLPDMFWHGADETNFVTKHHVLWRATVNARMQLQVGHDGHGDYWLRGRRTELQPDGDNAVELKPGETVVVGEEAGDVDRFFFDVGAGSDLSIELLDNADGDDVHDGNATMILYGPEGGAPVANWVWVGTEGLARGRYYLDVAMLVAGEDRLTVKVTEPEMPASVLPPGGSVAGELTAWQLARRYVMDVRAGVAYQFRVEGNVEKLGVQDEAGTRLGPYCKRTRWWYCMGAFDGPLKTMTWVAPRNERVHVELAMWPYGGADVYPYRLSVEEAGGWSTADLAGAETLAVNGAVEGVIEGSDAVDVYQVDARAGGKYELSMTWEEGKRSFLWIVGADERHIDQWHQPATVVAARQAPNWYATSDETYYVIVGGFDAGAYGLSLTEQIDDEAGHAREVTVPGVVAGTIDYEGDVDRVRFYAERGRSYVLRAESSLVQELHFDALSLESFKEYQWISSTGIVFAPRTSGVYEVTLYTHAYDSDPTGPYTVTIDYAADDQAGGAVSMGGRSVATGRIDFKHDRDFFTFDAMRSTVYHLRVEGAQELRLLDPDGRPVPLFDDGLLVAAKSGRYTVEVTSEESGAAYKLFVEEEPEDVIPMWPYPGSGDAMRRLRVGRETRVPFGENGTDHYWFLAEAGKRYVVEVWDLARRDFAGVHVLARHVVVRGGWAVWQRMFTARPERVHLIDVLGTPGPVYSLIVREVLANSRENGDGGHGGGAEVETDANVDAPVWDAALGWLDEDEYEDEAYEYGEWEDVGLFDEEWDVWLDEEDGDEVWADDESEWDFVAEEEEEE